MRCAAQVEIPETDKKLKITTLLDALNDFVQARAARGGGGRAAGRRGSLHGAQPAVRCARWRAPHCRPPFPTRAPRLPASWVLQLPARKTDAAMRLPISGIYKIKGVGDVLAGRVEQGIVKPGEEVIFLPTHTTANPCTGKVRGAEQRGAGAGGRAGGRGSWLACGRRVAGSWPGARADPPPLACRRCSPWRCTTSAWSLPAPATTWA